MTPHEQYLFDLQGFIAVPDALDAGQLAELNRILDEKIDGAMEPGATTHRFGFTLLDWGPAYRDLIDNPRIVPYLEQIVGPRFRLDHDYADIIRKGDGPIGTTLHGGAIPFDPLYSYTCVNQEIRCGLSVVAYNLKDVNPGDGGFGCVPGSHKSQLPLPRRVAQPQDRPALHPRRDRQGRHRRHLHRGADPRHHALARRRAPHPLLQVLAQLGILVRGVLRSRKVRGTDGTAAADPRGAERQVPSAG